MAQVDLSIAREFLGALGGLDTVYDFRAWPEKWQPRDTPATKLRGTFADCAPELVRRNAAGFGISVAINEMVGGGARLEDVRTARTLAVDFDRGRPESWGGPAPSIVAATPRGAHAYWLLIAGEGDDLATWSMAQRELCRSFREEVIDVAKVMRVPGFVHAKVRDDARLVVLEHCDPTMRFTMRDIVRSFHLTLHAPRKATSMAEGRVPLERRLERCRRFMGNCGPAIEGQGGYARTKGICNVGWDFGLQPHEFWPLLRDWNETCQPPWREAELERKLERLFVGHHDDAFGWRLDDDRRPPAGLARVGARPDVPWPTDADDGAAQRRVYRVGARPQEIDDDAGLEIGRRAAPPDDPEPASSDDTGTPPSEPPPTDSGGASSDGSDEVLVLNRNAPLETARKLEAALFRWKGTKILVHHHRTWWRWNGKSYKEVSPQDLNARIYGYAEHAMHPKVGDDGRTELVDFNPDDTRINKIRHALESVAHLDDDHDPPCWLPNVEAAGPRPEPREIVACANGLLHIPSDRFLGKRPDYFALSASTVTYNAKARRPERWLAFLEQLWPEDDESQQLLQEWFGLTLTPDTSFQKFLLIQGPKRSGKGTIARVIDALHGKGNVAWPTMTDLTSRFGLQTMLDKALAIMPDVRISSRLDQGAALEVLLRITGEDTCQIDRKNLPAIQVQIPSRFMLMTNVTPRLSDAGAAFASRALALKMEASFFGNEDRHLTTKLLGEIEGILLWSLEGLRRLLERGHFVQPKTGLELVDDLTELSTPVVAFVRERCELDGTKWESTDRLFEAWKKWCAEEGREAVGEKATFVRNLISSHPGLRKGRPSDGQGGRIRTVTGVRLLDVPGDGPAPIWARVRLGPLAADLE